MKALITGSTGTIGKRLCLSLEAGNWEIIRWQRDSVSISDYFAMKEFVSIHQPDVLFHLAAITSFDEKERQNTWQVNYEWPSELAWICRELDTRFVFTSTAMVFSGNQQSLITLDTAPDAVSGYGYEKRMAEQQVMKQNPSSVILRLGWQISENGHNTINHFLDESAGKERKIKASALWFPSCSFLNDTVRVLLDSRGFEPGIYMVNSNHCYNFLEISKALNIFYGKKLEIIPFEGLRQDNRMYDDRVNIPDLTRYFSNLL